MVGRLSDSPGEATQMATFCIIHRRTARLKRSVMTFKGYRNEVLQK